MKIISFALAGETRLGAVSGTLAVDLNRAYAALQRDLGTSAARAGALADADVPADAVRFLEGGTDAIRAAHEALEFAEKLDEKRARRELVRFGLEEIRLLPPVPNPPKIICVARNYGAHASEAGRELPDEPILFARFAKTLVASGDPVVRPAISPELDWEGELAVVIGRGGRHVTKQHALEYVAGYSIFNDVTVRDFQFRSTQYTAGKNFSASGPFGPYLVLADEVADPHDLEIRTVVSGTEMQRASTSEMIFDIPTIIATVAEFIELEPGDVIATGTPAGVGFVRKPPRFLRPGDTVSVSIEGLGRLENPVVAEEDVR